MNITEKVAYLKGLASGMELDQNDKNVKLINAIIDTLDEMAETMSELELDVVDISDQIDAVDEDLAEVEDYLFDSTKDESDDYSEIYEVKCPECGETMEITLSSLDDEILCTKCGSPLCLDFDIDE